jgi:hypothetical protein
MMTDKRMGTHAIGSAGELLVQYQLLKHGIDSARLTTDSGINLVMYVPGTRDAVTVQVKAAERPFRDGGTGPFIIGWFFPRACKAHWLAGVDVSRDMVWLFRTEDALHYASGNTENVFLYRRIRNARGPKAPIEDDFEKYRLDNVILTILDEAESDDARPIRSDGIRKKSRHQSEPTGARAPVSRRSRSARAGI